MAISNLDQLVAGMKTPQSFFKVGTAPEAGGVFYTPFYATGIPGAAVAPTPGLAGAALTSYAGQLPWVNPGSGQASYLTRFACSSSTDGVMLLCDRLWHNSGITVTTTTGQTINSVAWPARDLDGSANGRGVMVGIEVSSATGNGSAITNTTITYTDEVGTGSRTGTMPSFPATGVVGTFVPFSLQSGDFGVRSIQTLTLGTSYVSGTIHLVAYRPIGWLFTANVNLGGALSPLDIGLPQLFNDTVPFLLWMPRNNTAPTFRGTYAVAQG